MKCHTEHNGLPIAPRSQEQCAGCHRNIKSIAPDAQSEAVSDFRTDHPQFRLSLLDADDPDSRRRIRQSSPSAPEMIEHSNIKFNHALHLDPAGLRDPEGRRAEAGMRDAQGNRLIHLIRGDHAENQGWGIDPRLARRSMELMAEEVLQRSAVIAHISLCLR